MSRAVARTVFFNAEARKTRRIAKGVFEFSLITGTPITDNEIIFSGQKKEEQGLPLPSVVAVVSPA